MQWINDAPPEIIYIYRGRAVAFDGCGQLAFVGDVKECEYDPVKCHVVTGSEAMRTNNQVQQPQLLKRTDRGVTRV